MTATTPQCSTIKSRKVKLSEVAQRVSSKVAPEISSDTIWVGADHLIEGDSEIRSWAFTDDPMFPPTFRFAVPEGAILLHSRNPRKVARTGFSVITGEKLFALQSRDERVLLTDFLLAVLQATNFQNYAVARSGGSVNKFLNWTPLADFEFDLPPLEEQKRIVQLQAALSDSLSAVRDVLDRAGGVLDVLLQERFRTAGWDWTPSTLGEVATLTIGRTPPRNEPRYWTDNLEYPFCTIADMTSSSVSPKREGVTASAIEEGKAKLVPAGSLLMSFKLTIGRLGIAERDLYPNEAIVWIEPKDGVTRDFLRLWMEQQDLESLVGRAVKGKTLNGPALRSIPVSVPPTAIQEELVRTAERARRLQRDLRRKLVALDQLRTAVREIEMGQRDV